MGNLLSIFDGLYVLFNFQEEKAFYIHIYLQLKQEEKDSKIAKLISRIADVNVPFMMIGIKIHFLLNIDSAI